MSKIKIEYVTEKVIRTRSSIVTARDAEDEIGYKQGHVITPHGIVGFYYEPNEVIIYSFVHQKVIYQKRITGDIIKTDRAIVVGAGKFAREIIKANITS